MRRVLGYLPQDFGVYPKVTRRCDLLDHFAVLKGVTTSAQRREVVEALLQQVNLWDVRKRKLGTLLRRHAPALRHRPGADRRSAGWSSSTSRPPASIPEERNRFLNLLAEIGENVVVILSTHIVEDVTDLCPRMAIINQGEVLLTGEPHEAIRSLEGRVWTQAVDKAELAELPARA